MEKNILQCLEKTATKFPDKIIYEDINRSDTYATFVEIAKKIGSGLIKDQRNQPIVIYIDKSVSCLETMMGVVYSGNFFTVLDIKSPNERMNSIIETLSPVAMVVEKKNLERAKELQFDGTIYIYEELIQCEIDCENLNQIRSKMIDTDPMFAQFTSGSTGKPKGIIICHRSVIDYASSIVNTFNITEETKFGSETPLYFSMSTLDIYSTILSGATFVIIPKMYFSFPMKLLDFINEKQINTVYWVPSVLCIIANMKALDEIQLPYLKKVLFAGEVMPVKQLNVWIEHMPDTLFANLYGPTEITDTCTHYIVNRKLENTESLPIGKITDNAQVLIIKDDGTEAKRGEEGELCVRGSFLAMGYYNNPEKTTATFVQNPLNSHYPEIIYKTGDIVKENETGEIIYISRKDFQIKHMGYRIELRRNRKWY